jgi:23S rRNA (uracil1939-C5)-methyltransferase
MQPELEIECTSLVYGGSAMGRLPDGRAVFVPFALPGERILARLVEEKRGFARAELLQVLRPAAERIQPRCRHFCACGGCHYQHMPYAFQLQAKQAIFRDQIERIAGVINPPLQPIVASPSEWNYRNTVQFHLSPQGKLGFQRAESNEVIEIQECHLPDAALIELWPQLDFEPLPGLERVALRVGADGDLMAVLESDGETAPELSVEELPISIVLQGPGGSLVLAGDEAIIQEVNARAFRVSAGAFFQVNLPQAAAMARHVLDLVPDWRGKSVLDVYCGVGLFSAFLAERGALVTGVEASPAACEDFAANLDEFEDISLYQGTAGEVLPGLELRPDVVLVDPPRAGLEKPALDALLNLGAPILIYISCDPSTLARDTKRLLAGGYQLEQATPFDLFPQTYHIESISLFTRLVS